MIDLSKPKVVPVPTRLRDLKGDILRSAPGAVTPSRRPGDLRTGDIVHGFYAIIPPALPWHDPDLEKSSLVQ